MSVATAQNSVASQQEFLRPELELLYMESARVWSRIKVRTDVKPVSTRPSRIPFEVLAGGDFRVADFDGGDLGDGSGPQEAFGNLSCISLLQASAYTALAEWSTDSDQKSIKDYVSLINERATQTMAGYMDALLQGSGANDLDTVQSVVTGGIVIQNANSFQDNQRIDIWTAIGGTFVATVQIQSVDSGSNTIWLTAAVPGAVATGQVILVNGSSGVANSGLYGLRYYQVNGNAGTYMGISRSGYPGKFSTPYINVGGSLTPAVVRALEGQIELAMSIDRADKAGLIAHCNVDMRAAWENNSILVQRVIMNEVKGDESVDMLKKKAPTVIAGRELLVNERAKPGIIDFLGLENWFRIETKSLDYYEVAGQTVFPAYGASGGIASKMLFYLVLMTQIGNGQPRIGAYMNNITIPAGYFGN